MTPSARIQTSIDLVRQADESSMPFDFIVNGFFRGKRYVGSKDRRFISERVFGIQRRKSRLDWWVDRTIAQDLSGEKRARARLIADLVLLDNETRDGIIGLFNGTRHCPAELDENELRLASTLQGYALDHPDMQQWTGLEYPEWLHDSFYEIWGDDLNRQMNALNDSASLDLRVNSLKSTRLSVLKALQSEGIEAEQTALSPYGLRVHRRLRLGGMSPYKDGHIEVQDEGSQVVSLLSDVKPGMTVIDYCAGGGGKTLAIGAEMKNKGMLYACDISSKRLGRLDSRIKRAGLKGVNVVDLSSHESNTRLPKQVDRILLDVPCSGTGTWRRNPDAKWRLNSDMLTRHTERQAHLLDQAAPMVKPGGRMIYITCSVLPQENERQIEGFLSRSRDYAVRPIAGIWNDLIDAPCPTNENFLRLTPADHKTDGFFCAVLERTA